MDNNIDVKHNEGKWHETLQALRLEFKREMSGEVAGSMRTQGVENAINFGVQWHRLRELATKIPHSEELADLMWSKDVREMKLLSILLYPLTSLTEEKAIKLIYSSPNLETTEQLVATLIAKMETAEHIAQTLWLKHSLDTATPHIKVAPYIILMRLGMVNKVSIDTISIALDKATDMLSAPQSYSPLDLLYLSRALTKVLEGKSDEKVKRKIETFAGKLKSFEDTKVTSIGEDLLDLIQFLNEG